MRREHLRLCQSEENVQSTVLYGELLGAFNLALFHILITFESGKGPFQICQEKQKTASNSMLPQSHPLRHQRMQARPFSAQHPALPQRNHL